MKKYASMTVLYALSHFIVDFSCAYLIFSILSDNGQWLKCLLTYNFFAFAMQMPLGLLADKFDRNRFFAASGCILILISPFLDNNAIMLSSVAGLGNALFHIGAGRDVLCGARQRFSALGLFVSPGAIGLYLGILLGKRDALPIFAILGALLIVSAVILIIIPMLYDKDRMTSPPIEISLNGGRKTAFMLLCLFLVVCLRSYVGMTLSFPWKGEGSFALILAVSVVLGKASGGFLADRFGAIPVSIATLGVCALLLLFYKIPLCGILAVLLFNMTMPITLGAVTKIFPSAMGFGFGLLTFALFLGFLPVLTGAANILALPYGFSAACILSACLLYIGLKEPEYAD